MEAVRAPGLRRLLVPQGLLLLPKLPLRLLRLLGALLSPPPVTPSLLRVRLPHLSSPHLLWWPASSSKSLLNLLGDLA